MENSVREFNKPKQTTPIPLPRKLSYNTPKAPSPKSDRNMSTSAPKSTEFQVYDNDTVVTKSKYPLRSKGKTISCSRFKKTGTPYLDSNLHEFEQELAKDEELGMCHAHVYAGKDFAGGTFDINGGYLTLPEHKITMYIPSRSIVDGSEPLIITADRQMTKGPSLQDGEHLVSPIITCGKVGTEIHMEQDIVISFPLSMGATDSDFCDTFQPMRKDIGNDSPWQILADGIDCLKVVNQRNGRCTLMVDRLGCYAIVANNPVSVPFDVTSSNLCIGVFGRASAKTDTANIVVFVWRDSTSAKQRVLAEELQEGLVLMDQIRHLAVQSDDKKIHVELRNIKPGWILRTKEHQRTFQVSTLLSNFGSSCLPSCTFALEYTASTTMKVPVAKCTVEVYTGSEEYKADMIQFEVAIGGEQSSGFGTKCTVVEKQRRSPNQLQRKPRPPPCLTYHALREIAALLCLPPKGRHFAAKSYVWKTFAQEVGLKRADIQEVEERYSIRSPGGALLDLYFGEQLADSRSPRDITAKLLAIFKKIGQEDITHILKRELRQFDHRGKAEIQKPAPRPAPCAIGPYEEIEVPLMLDNTAKSTVKRSPSSVSTKSESFVSKYKPEETLAKSKGTSRSLSYHVSPKLPQRNPRKNADHPPEPPPKDHISKRVQSPTPPHRSPKPLPRVPTPSSEGDLSDDNDDESDGKTLYDRPALPQGPTRRTSFLYGDGSAFKVNKILGAGSQSRDSKFSHTVDSYPLSRADKQNRILPPKPGDGETQEITDTKVRENKSLPYAYRNSDFDDVKLAKPKVPVSATAEENAYSDIPEKERQRILMSSAQNSNALVNERKKMFESADQALHDVQSKLTKVAQTGGARAKSAASSATKAGRIVVAQLKDRLSRPSMGRRSNQSSRPIVSNPEPLAPEKSPFQDTLPLPSKYESPTYESVPVEFIKSLEQEDPYLKPNMEPDSPELPPKSQECNTHEKEESTIQKTEYPPPPSKPPTKPPAEIEDPDPTYDEMPIYDSPVSWQQRPADKNPRFKTKNEYSQSPV